MRVLSKCNSERCRNHDRNVRAADLSEAVRLLEVVVSRVFSRSGFAKMSVISELLRAAIEPCH